MKWGWSWIWLNQRLKSVKIIFRLQIGISCLFIFQLPLNIFAKLPEIMLKVTICYHELHELRIVCFFVHFDFLLQFLSYFINLVFYLVFFRDNLFNLLFFFFWSLFHCELNYIIEKFLILAYFHFGINDIFLKHWRFILPSERIKLSIWFRNTAYMLENSFIFFLKDLSFQNIFPFKKLVELLKRLLRLGFCSPFFLIFVVYCSS